MHLVILVVLGERKVMGNFGFTWLDGTKAKHWNLFICVEIK